MAEAYFDTRDGKLLIGEEAVESRVMGAGPGDVLPLQSILTSDSDTLPNGQYDRLHPDDWTVEDYIDFGRWALGVLDPQNREVPLQTKHIETLYNLGLGPSFERIQSRFDGKLSNYREQIGSGFIRKRKVYSDWTDQEFLDYAAQLSQQLGRMPIDKDYNEAYLQGRGPNYQMIYKTVGGQKLREYLGYPDVHSWIEDDYIDWGVRVMEANDGRQVDTYTIRILSKRFRGPSPKPIGRIFGDLKKFQTRITEEYTYIQEVKQQLRQQKTAEYTNMLESGKLPAGYSQLPKDEFNRRAGIVQLLTRLTPKMYPAKKFRIARSGSDIVKRILKIRSDLSQADIETIAETLYVSGDIWPEPQGYLQYLKVSEQERVEFRQKKELGRRSLSAAA